MIIKLKINLSGMNILQGYARVKFYLNFLISNIGFLGWVKLEISTVFDVVQSPPLSSPL